MLWENVMWLHQPDCIGQRDRRRALGVQASKWAPKRATDDDPVCLNVGVGSTRSGYRGLQHNDIVAAQRTSFIALCHLRDMRV